MILCWLGNDFMRVLHHIGLRTAGCTEEEKMFAQIDVIYSASLHDHHAVRNGRIPFTLDRNPPMGKEFDIA